MSLTLSDGTTLLTLPDDLEWADEHAWQPVAQSTGYSLTGALVVETASKQTGRPITLTGDADRAWLSRAQVDQLMAWAAVAGKVLTLTLRGASRSVVFRHQDGAAISAKQIVPGAPISTPGGGTYVVTLNLMEI